MKQDCIIPRCTKTVTSYGQLCKAHQTAKARWGSAEQKPVTKAELSHAKARVKRMIDSRADPALLHDKLATGLLSLITEARADGKSTMKIPGGRSRCQATRHVLAICAENEPEEVILTAVALAYMAGQDKRFVDDSAFFTSTGRRLFLLAASSFTTTVNPKSAKRSRTPKDLRSSVLFNLGQRFMEAFGGVGLALRAREVLEAEKAKDARREALRIIAGDEEAV